MERLINEENIPNLKELSSIQITANNEEELLYLIEIVKNNIEGRNYEFDDDGKINIKILLAR